MGTLARQERWQQQPEGVAVPGAGARENWQFPWRKPPALIRLALVS